MEEWQLPDCDEATICVASSPPGSPNTTGARHMHAHHHAHARAQIKTEERELAPTGSAGTGRHLRIYLVALDVGGLELGHQVAAGCCHLAGREAVHPHPGQLQKNGLHAGTSGFQARAVGQLLPAWCTGLPGEGRPLLCRLARGSGVAIRCSARSLAVWQLPG